jgi:hypothetical protein
MTLEISCVDCGAVAPATETPYTLIGQRFGWRLVHVVDARGKRVPEWRCDKCFRKAKAERDVRK